MLQNKIVKDDHIIVSVTEDSLNVLEEYSSAEELIVESSDKDRNNKMYNVVKSLSGSEGKKNIWFHNYSDKSTIEFLRKCYKFHLYTLITFL